MIGLTVWLAVLRAGAAYTDGGAVCLQRESGGYQITVFASPFPLTVGLTDLSVMVQDRARTTAVLDAQVRLTLTPARGEPERITKLATRAQARNKLLYAATVNLATSGRWRVRVEVLEHGQKRAVSGVLSVEASNGIGAEWKYVAIVPIAIALFALQQFLVFRRRVRA